MAQFINTPVAGGGLFSGSGQGTGSGLSSLIGQISGAVANAKQVKVQENQLKAQLTKQYLEDYYKNPELMEAANPLYKEMFKEVYGLKDDEVDDFIGTLQQNAPTDPNVILKSRTEATLEGKGTPPGGQTMPGQEQPVTETTPGTETATTTTTTPQTTSTTEKTQVPGVTTQDGRNIKDIQSSTSQAMKVQKNTKGLTWDGKGTPGEEAAVQAEAYNTKSGGLTTGEGITNVEAAENFLYQQYIQGPMTKNPESARAMAKNELAFYQSNPSATTDRIDTELQGWKQQLTTAGYSDTEAQQIIDISRTRVMDYFGIGEKGEPGTVQYRYTTEYGLSGRNVDAGEVILDDAGAAWFVPTENMRGEEDISYYGGLQAYHGDVVQTGTFPAYYKEVLDVNRDTLQELYDENAESVPDKDVLRSGGAPEQITNTDGTLTEFGLMYMMDYYGSTDVEKILLPDMGSPDTAMKVDHPDLTTEDMTPTDDPKKNKEKATKIYMLSRTSGEEAYQERQGNKTRRTKEIYESERTGSKPYSSFYEEGYVEPGTDTAGDSALTQRILDAAKGGK